MSEPSIKDIGYEPFPCETCRHNSKAKFGQGCTAPGYLAKNHFDRLEHWEQKGACQFAEVKE